MFSPNLEMSFSFPKILKPYILRRMALVRQLVLKFIILDFKLRFSFGELILHGNNKQQKFMSLIVAYKNNCFYENVSTIFQEIIFVDHFKVLE